MLSKNIKKYRKEAKLTQRELAEKLDVAPTAVSAWELGRNKPLMDNIEKMSILFNVKKSDIIGDEKPYINQLEITNDITTIYNQLEPPRQEYVYSVAEEQLEEQNNVLQFPTEQTRSIITNRRSAAGNMIEVDDELASKEVIPASMVPKGADELVEITGASMEPLIMQGSEVYIRHQPSVENGEVAIVRIENEGVTCKRVYFENNMIRLKSENDDYEDMFFDSSQVTVLGKVLL